MKKLVRRITLLALGCIFSVLVAAATTQAQVPIVTDTYAAKFICGVQRDASLFTVPDAQAGHYSTKINVTITPGLPSAFVRK